MSTISDAAIAGYAAGAGFSGNGLVMAVAIALAESGGDVTAQGLNRAGNGTVTSVDRGLWQINNYYHQEVTDGCAYNPACAANAAYTISRRGANWMPWSTYNNGQYKKFLPRANSASVSSQGRGGSPASQPPAPPSGAMPNPIPVATPNSLTTQPVNVAQGTGLLYTQPGVNSAFQDVSYRTLGSTSNSLDTTYKLLVALAIMFGFLYVLSRTRIGYVALYYGEVLILFFLFVTQAQFFKESLLPLATLSQPKGDVASSPAPNSPNIQSL